jgi:integrase
MARKTEKLITFTQARVAALPAPASGRFEYHDEGLAGLLVRVTATGVKSFCVLKRLKRGKPIRVTLGRFPGLTVDRARALAAAHLGEMAAGANPAERRKADKALALTLQDAWLEYKAARTGKAKARTLKDYGKMLDRYLSDWLGKPVVSITRDGVQTRHAKITEDNGPHAADDTMRVLRAVLNYAADTHEVAGQSLLPDNPVRRALKRAWNRPTRRRTALADGQVPQWWDGLQQLRGKFPDAADLFTLCFLTGMRPGEAARLRVDKVDLVAKTLTVEDTKNRESLVLPLTMHVFGLLERRVQAATGSYVFPGPGRTGHLVEWKKGAIELRGLASLPQWIPYDLRRTYLTVAESLDLATYALKALANHKQPQDDVTGGYLKITSERLRKPAQQVEDKLLKLAGVKPSADVVPLRARTGRGKNGS